MKAGLNRVFTHEALRNLIQMFLDGNNGYDRTGAKFVPAAMKLWINKILAILNSIKSEIVHEFC